jgi:hypothetical protein
MIAFKFLRAGRVGPFSRFQWPDAGVWIRPTADSSLCRRGIHACRIQDLPWWLDDQLWKVELDGEVLVGRHKLVATAGRLISQVHAWTPTLAEEYGVACGWRARNYAVRSLDQAGRSDAAAELAACDSLHQLPAVVRRMLDHVPKERISLTMAADGALRATSGPPPTAAYIAAHAARRIEGARGYMVERAWQSTWLKDRLNLDADPDLPQATRRSSS